MTTETDRLTIPDVLALLKSRDHEVSAFWLRTQIRDDPTFPKRGLLRRPLSYDRGDVEAWLERRLESPGAFDE